MGERSGTTQSDGNSSTWRLSKRFPIQYEPSTAVAIARTHINLQRWIFTRYAFRFEQSLKRRLNLRFCLEGPTPPLSPALTSSSGASSGSQLRSPIGGLHQDPRQRADSISANSSAEETKGQRLQRSATVSSTTSGSSGGSGGQQRGDFYKTLRDNIARDAGTRPPVPVRKDTKESVTPSEGDSEVMLAYGRDSIADTSVSDVSSPPMGSGASLSGNEEKIVFPSFPPSPPPVPQLPPKSLAANRPSVVSLARTVSSASAYSIASNPRGVSRSNPQGVDRKLLDTLNEDSLNNGDGSFGLSALARMDPSVPPLPSSPPSASISIPSSSRAPATAGAPRRSRTTPSSLLSPHLKKKDKGRVKDCVTCSKKIDDGRWVPVAAGSNGKAESDQGVLCESCWKKMYLPRVSSLLISSFDVLVFTPSHLLIID